MLGLGSFVTLLMLLLSLFEGGDVAWKHRLQVWAPLALVVQLGAMVLLLVAAVAVAGDRPTGPSRTWAAAGLVLVLAGGWGWVGVPHLPGSHNDSRSLVLIWLTWTIPAIIAAGLVGRRPTVN
jgi:hypothetical protein